MVILVLNCGSSSIKYQVLDVEAAAHKLLAKGIVEQFVSSSLYIENLIFDR